MALSIIASFSSAILAATGLVNNIIIAIVAAIPGVILVLDKGFVFSKRWRWHNTNRTKMLVLEQKLIFEDACVKDISAEMTETLLDMERRYPKGNMDDVQKV